MRYATARICSICGDGQENGTPWFLVAENHWEDKLRILQWNDRLASHEGIHPACGLAHVRELVVHWMTTGSLDYPFARVGPARKPFRRWGDVSAPREEMNHHDARFLGELSVDRESMVRVLHESPHSLNTILEVLLRALQRERATSASTLDLERGAAPSLEI